MNRTDFLGKTRKHSQNISGKEHPCQYTCNLEGQNLELKKLDSISSTET
jgi:hypothetical protein